MGYNVGCLMRKQHLSIRLSDDENAKLEKVAMDRGLSVSTLARMLILEGLNDHSIAKEVLKELSRDAVLRAAFRRIVVLDLPPE